MPHPFSCLKVNLKPDSPKLRRACANVLPNEGEPFVGEGDCLIAMHYKSRGLQWVPDHSV